MGTGMEFIGLKKFNVLEISTIKSLSDQYYRKLVRDFKEGKLRVTAKKFVKAGERSKYSIHLRIDCPSLILNATDADWELPRALHKAFTNLQNEVKKRFKRIRAKQKSFKG